MTARTVRRAVQSYLQGLEVSGISKIYRAQPWEPIADQGWQFTDGRDSDAVVIVHIESQDETRETLPAAYPGRTAVGNKRVDYKIGLVLLYQFLIPDELPVTADTDVWVDDLDTLVDALRDGIHADPTLGCANTGPILQAGQDPNDLAVTYDFPRLLADKVLVWQVLHLTVTEIINV